jgi:hypothetical protein
VKRRAWYYRWSAETYLAFHAIRTLVTLRCVRASAPERNSLVFSTRLLRLRLTKYLRWENIRAAVKMFLHKYRRAVVEKKKWWFVLDCDRFVKIDGKSVRNYVSEVRVEEKERVEEFLLVLISEVLDRSG